MDQIASHSSRTHFRDYLKQIIYGGNDGIVTTFAIVAGFAGANAEGVAQIGGVAVMIFGLANLFADAVSMGLGEFLSSRSAHDLYRARRTRRIQRITTQPASSIAELSETLTQKGLPQEEANHIATQLTKAPQLMAEMLLSHKHGVQPPEDDSPALNGLVTFVSFVLFGFLPLLPYLLREADAQSLTLSATATLTALAALGLLRWGATGDRLRVSVLETVGVGSLCAGVAYGVGWLVGG
ncbi:VIT1/CCC1 transporter family protein [Thalassovita sp.]|uniref:VIT1/CCC1 transporter family protein n=1 Tax=Thalassovita sp. TaxID=1979401 RepID=UPI002881B979|nr:VIT1/CCC1 transporter family protein [Thalassovita sp.]MDF1801425.1 VIT1/CCC1 transporter family protein [Thalassovita sp.]